MVSPCILISSNGDENNSGMQEGNRQETCDSKDGGNEDVTISSDVGETGVYQSSSMEERGRGATPRWSDDMEVGDSPARDRLEDEGDITRSKRGGRGMVSRGPEEVIELGVESERDQNHGEDNSAPATSKSTSNRDAVPTRAASLDTTDGDSHPTPLEVSPTRPKKMKTEREVFQIRERSCTRSRVKL
jgi:hypothetical protein